MTMRNQDEIDILERGDFILRIFENGIREPRIDEQNFSVRSHNLESRLTVPSELRVHGNHKTETVAQGKSGERRLLACSVRQLAERIFVQFTPRCDSCSRQAAANCRLAACSPEPENRCVF
jgi:hypothetical protein